LGYWILRQESDFHSVVESPTHWFYDWFREVNWESEEPPDYVLGAINEAKMRATTLDEFSDFFLQHDPQRANQLTRLWEMYEKRKKSEGVVDFADMIWKCWQLLSRKPDIREKYQSKFQHVIVDESQDLNPVQMKMVDLLTKGDCSLMLIGDIRQSIYGFRGADPEALIDFARDRDMNFYHLPNNYRSCEVIVDRSNELAREQEASHEFPDCEPVRTGDGKVYSVVLSNAVEEAKWVSSKVQSKIENGTSPEDIGILYRVNAQ
jgi:DNA helicase-2/ATP-dependent DNA helicase PcrA